MNETLIPDIVEAVAEKEGRDPAELDFVLAEHIDPEALCQLAEHNNSTWTLTFELPEHTVTVENDGTIIVEEYNRKHGIVQ